MSTRKKAVLIILDGWGYGNHSQSDAIHHARTPFMDGLHERFPHSTLRTSGEDVGLPDGQMGNSEVGHLNLGAGRVVYQDLVRINRACADRSINTNPVLVEAMQHAKNAGVNLHFMGLVSNGGVHSSQEHLHHLCSMATELGVQNAFVHAFTDGRDTDPKSGLGFVTALENHLATTNCKLASVVGRYYAMDRDKRWERVKLAYDLLTKGVGTSATDMLQAIQASYNAGVTDEFIKPIVRVNEAGQPLATIQPNDVVICFNFRTDRCREITVALTQQEFPEQAMHTLPLHYVTMTRYDDTFKNVQVVFEKDNLSNTIGEVLANAGKKQIRIAETEKYPHVSFFFSGGREEPFEGEKRIMVNSPKVATYDLQPEMSAPEVTAAIVAELQKGETDFVCLNFANPDMVGHTGVYPAIIKAVETVDDCTRQVVEAGLANGYSFIIIADHGNADFAINSDGSPNTAHTTNPVPCILIDSDHTHIRDGKLGDVAPTLLTLMGLAIPAEMTGEVLV